MTTNEIVAWVQVVQTLVGIGVNVVSSLKGLLSTAHPSLTPEQLNAAYAAILTDDALRSAFAARASAGSSPQQLAWGTANANNAPSKPPR